MLEILLQKTIKNIPVGFKLITYIYFVWTR